VTNRNHALRSNSPVRSYSHSARYGTIYKAGDSECARNET